MDSFVIKYFLLNKHCSFLSKMIDLYFLFSCTKVLEFTEHCVEDGLQMFDSKYFNKNTPEIVLYSNPFYGNFASVNIKPMIEGRLMSRMVITVCNLSMHS